MLCKNCNYILTGKENYCPNCASPLTEKASQTPEKKEEQKEDKHNEQVIKREFIFPESDAKSYETQRDMRIFYEANEPEEVSARQKKKGYGGRIMLLLFLTCAFSAAAFAFADYFGITPSVVSSLVQGAVSTETTASAFSHESSIIKPDITYTPERAYIMSGEGLSLRKGPGKGYAPVDTLGDLTMVVIYGGSLVDAGWVYVYCAEKECYGWLDGSFLARDSSETTTLFAENADEDTEESTSQKADL